MKIFLSSSRFFPNCLLLLSAQIDFLYSCFFSENYNSNTFVTTSQNMVKLTGILNVSIIHVSGDHAALCKTILVFVITNRVKGFK